MTTAEPDDTPGLAPGVSASGRRVLDRGGTVPSAEDLFDEEADPLAATYHLRVDGVLRSVAGACLADSLLTVLRDRLGIISVKDGCEQGRCGSCSVLLDDKVVAACTVLAADAVDARVTTLAGLPTDGLGPVVQAEFLRAGAVQCGFCTPGFVVAVTDLLTRRPDASEQDIRAELAGNLCRCTGYGRILAAVRAVQAGLGDRS